MKTLRVRLARPGIRGKLSMWGLANLVLAFLIIAGLSWIIADAQANIRIGDQIDAGMKSSQGELDRETQDLKTLTSWLVADPTFLQMVESKDGAGLAKYLQPFTQTSIVDALVVTDGSGTVVTRVQRDEPETDGDTILSSAGIAEGLKGESSSGFEQDKFGHLQGRLITPIVASPQDSSLGVLVSGYFLDEEFLDRLGTRGIAEVAILYQDGLKVTSLTDRQGKRVTALTLPSEVILAEAEGRASAPVAIKTAAGPYLFRFKPLPSPAGTAVGMYGIGVSLASLDDQRRALFQALGLGLLAAAACVVGVGYLFARLITAPIRVLGSAAQSMATGDLSTSIVLSTHDELGDLARKMENMRQQLQQASRSASLEKSRYEAIVRCMGVAAVITDQNQCIVVANPHAEAVLRRSLADIVDHSFQDFLDLAIQSNPSMPASAASAGPEPDGQRDPLLHSRFHLRGQSQVVLDVICTPVQIGAESAGYVHIVQDFSAHEKLLQSKDDFVLNVAHELRGPLASLRTFIELLEEDYATLSTQDAQHLMQALDRAVGRLQSLLDNLMDIGTIRSGQFTVRPLPSQLEGIIEEAVSQVEPLLKASGQPLERHDRTGLVVMADWQRVVQVLLNLLTNASKYSPENQPITLAVHSENGFVRIQVTDCGPGIAPEDQLHLFERFYRVKGNREGAVGIGLGLALSKAIVESLGGQIGLDTHPGQGTTFWFTLPLFQPEIGH